MKCEYEYWLATLQGITGKRKRELHNTFESAKELFRIEESAVADGIISEKEYDAIRGSRTADNWKREYEDMQKKNIHFCTIQENCYPDALREIYTPPYAIYYKGSLPETELPSVAVVGARQCTFYGKSIAEEIGSVCGEHGVQLISGMARGVDGISQGNAVRAKGKSFAVLGCGVDICYPREHRMLYESIQERGGVLSEFPPGMPPLAGNFPARNRIISGLSQAVVVVEAKEKSGSLITADFALEQGKTVYAVPGPVTSALSRGCNQLIRQGAEIFLSSGELLEDLHAERAIYINNYQKSNVVLEKREKLVYSCLDLVPQTIDDIHRKSQLDVSETVAVLTSLVLKDYAEVLSRNYYVRKEKY